MLEATSSPQRIKGLLPVGTPVAHKSGSSGEEFGMIPATHDVGLITLPDGRRLAVAIFLSDAHADQATCEASPSGCLPAGLHFVVMGSLL
jgi:beta-lactamase class A